MARYRLAPKYAPDSDAPYGSVIPVTASDADDLPNGMTRALLVGTAGVATIVDGSGETRADVPLQVGVNRIHCFRVFSTGLTAADIFACY